MKRGRSTGKPTAEEAAWIVAVKEGPCLACMIHRGGAPFGVGCDAHHILSGGIRRGHLFTIGLCAWHHRGVVMFGGNHKEHREHLGPSLMDGSKLFRDAYGSDDELLQLQKEVLGYA